MPNTYLSSLPQDELSDLVKKTAEAGGPVNKLLKALSSEFNDEEELFTKIFKTNGDLNFKTFETNQNIINIDDNNNNNNNYNTNNNEKIEKNKKNQKNTSKKYKKK